MCSVGYHISNLSHVPGVPDKTLSDTSKVCIDAVHIAVVSYDCTNDLSLACSWHDVLIQELGSIFA